MTTDTDTPTSLSPERIRVEMDAAHGGRPARRKVFSMRPAEGGGYEILKNGQPWGWDNGREDAARTVRNLNGGRS